MDNISWCKVVGNLKSAGIDVGRTCPKTSKKGKHAQNFRLGQGLIEKMFIHAD
jgi:hypothetical protein